jgi:hypothetical protein
VRRKRKGDWRGVGVCGGRGFDSILVFIVAMGINFLMLIA